ncbi:MAG: hypothetical protein ACLVJR_04800 [Negativibacillus sp.]
MKAACQAMNRLWNRPALQLRMQPIKQPTRVLMQLLKGTTVKVRSRTARPRRAQSRSGSTAFTG